MKTSNTLPKNAPLVVLFVSQLASVVIGLIGEFSAAELSGGQIVAIMGAADFVGIAIAFILWAVTVSKKQVLEKLLDDGTVVAGEANDMVPAGTEIRTIEPTPTP